MGRQERMIELQANFQKDKALREVFERTQKYIAEGNVEAIAKEAEKSLLEQMLAEYWREIGVAD